MKQRLQSATVHYGPETVPSKRPKIQLSPLASRPHRGLAGKARKKTLEACEKCRERRTKCNGEWPCESCSSKGFECSLKPGLPDDQRHLSEVLEQVLSRLRRVEDAVSQQRRDSWPERQEGRRADIADRRTVASVSEFNRQTGCFEYYGETSNFVIADSLGKRLGILTKDDDTATSSASRQKEVRQNSDIPAEPSSSSDVPELRTLIDAYDYVMPLNAPTRRYRQLQQDVADRHLDNFFATIHTYFPIFDVPRFRSTYAQLRELFGSNVLYSSPGPSQGHQQSLCLLYAVLALGALYAGDAESSSWAAWYFSEAQELLGRLFDAVNLQLVQAGMFMGAYAQHALKPNLAYNLAGTATRMAFSIGLNLDPTLAAHDWDAEEGRRTWWMLFVQEVELSLDSGRPMSIRKSDMSINYPTGHEVYTDHVKQSQAEEPDRYQLSDFIQHLAGVAQITRDILKFVSTPTGRSLDSLSSWEARLQTLNRQLIQWRTDLPKQYQFQAVLVDEDLAMPLSWMSRQRSSLLAHYNLAMIVLHRFSLTKPDVSIAKDTAKRSQSACIEAASLLIVHIHGLFQVAPSIRRWRYYCYYCLQATLVLLFKVIDEPDAERTQEIVETCQLSIAIFKQIELKAAQRCADLVDRVLGSQHRRQQQRQLNLRPTSGEVTEPYVNKKVYAQSSGQRNSRPSLTEAETTSFERAADPHDAPNQENQQQEHVPAQEEGTNTPFTNDAQPQSGIFDAGATDDYTTSSCPDLTFSGTEWDFSVDDDMWNEFVESGMHVRPFDSWMSILNDQEGR